MPTRTMDSKLKYMIEDKEVSVFDGGLDMTAFGLMPYRGHLGTKAIRKAIRVLLLGVHDIKSEWH